MTSIALKDARAFLSASTFIPWPPAVTATGAQVFPTHHEATRWSLLGALCKVTDGDEALFDAAGDALLKHLPPGETLISVSCLGLPVVLEMLDAAIAEEEKRAA